MAKSSIYDKDKSTKTEKVTKVQTEITEPEVNNSTPFIESNSIMSTQEMNRLVWPYINLIIQTSLFAALNALSIYGIFYFYSKELINAYTENTLKSTLKGFFNPFVLIPFIYEHLLPITITYSGLVLLVVFFSLIRTYLNNIKI